MKNRDDILKALEEKFKNMGQNLDTHLKGLLQSTPITYWDYIQTDALLSLQTQRTQQPDEMVFIVYHQINELLFKMVLWEMDQVTEGKNTSVEFFALKLDRISRYFDMLSSSFSIMRQGMEPAQYLKFRDTLTPASGFQSAQYRKIEFASTDLINLIDRRFRASIDRNTPFEHAYEHLYWQAAGKNYDTGDKTTLLSLFQERYMEDFLTFMKKYNTSNLWLVFLNLPVEDQMNVTLQNAMRHYDYTVNVKWVISHYRAATKYLDDGNEVIDATGGSDWKKYMHPQYQRRIFFPGLWSEKELEDWGKDGNEDEEILKTPIQVKNKIVV
jgi:tryptophan 2,3-dioxygenase